VLHLLSIDGTVQAVAAAAVRAAEKALRAAGKDPRFEDTFRFVVQLGSEPFVDVFSKTLSHLGLDVDGGPTIVQFLGALPDAIGRRRAGHEQRTELGGLGPLALVETLGQALQSGVDDWLGANDINAHRAFARIAASKERFDLVSGFMGVFLYRCLQYFLSRETPNRVGEQRRFGSIEELAEFNRDLKAYCIASSRALFLQIGDIGVTKPYSSANAVELWQSLLEYVLIVEGSHAK
jgi:hypothetical protein